MADSAAEFLTIKQASRLLGIDYKTLYNLIHEGLGPRVHLFRFNVTGDRRVMRIHRSELKTWLDSRGPFDYLELTRERLQMMARRERCA